MLLDSKKIVGISEVNQNFSKIAKMVDDNKMITIMKNNKPKYVMIAYEEFEKNSKNDEVDDIANRILQKNIEDFKELARMKYLTIEYVLKLHKKLIEATGGSSHIRIELH